MINLICGREGDAMEISSQNPVFLALFKEHGHLPHGCIFECTCGDYITALPITEGAAALSVRFVDFWRAHREHGNAKNFA